MEETMKCLKNTKTGNIIRVSDVQAYQMAGNTWKYVSKTEWKGVKEIVVEETKQPEIGHDMGGSYEIKPEKKSKSKKKVS
jgi:hypothetical protein